MKSLCTKYGKRGLSMLLILAMVFSLGFLNTTAKAISIDDVKSSVETALLLSELFSGSGTDESPYLIADEQDLIELQLISNGTGDSVLQSAYAHGTGMYFKLTADISLTADWAPIANGSDYYFAGSFDGAGHTISGLNMTVEAAAGETAYGGLFGYTDGATISNLTVTGGVSISLTANEENTDSSAIYAGGIIGFALDTTVSDCAVNVTVKAENAATGTVNVVAGGAVGYLGTSASGKTAAVANVNAKSGMTVEANTSAHGNEILTLAGGIVGIAEGATVENSSSAAGVVVSGSKTTYSLASYTYAGQFNDDRTGTHDLNGYYYSNTAGGVVGAAISLFSTVQTDTGSGNTTNSSITAEIINETVVSACNCTGTVLNQTDTSLSFAGGVVGTLLYATVTGDDATNNFSGSVSAPYAGGIAGIVVGTSTISDVVENGTVLGAVTAGGVAGQLGNHAESSNSIIGTTVISDCMVTGGSVTCNDGYAGGIVGYMTYADSISDSTNAATVSGSNAGGILGGVLNSYSSSGGAYANGSINYNVSLSNNAVTDCNNTGAVSGSISAGGVAGYVANPCTTISDCSNSGSVTSTASGTDDSYAGGVIAYYYSIPDYSESLMRNVGNSANVTGSATYAGGVIGYLNGQTLNISNTSVVLLNSYNVGTVTGSEYVGGIAGRAVYGFGNCYNSGTVSGTSYVGALAGGASSISTYSDSYALNNSASSLIGTTSGSSSQGSQENLVFFDADQKLAEDTNGYGTLLVALNNYVEDVGTDDVTLSHWASVSGAYPTFTSDFTAYAATTPDTPVVAYTLGTESSNTATSVEIAAGSGDTLVLSTSNVTCGDGETILYQWYSSTSDSVSAGTAISGATGTSYTVDTSASGITYYWVSAAIQNPYTRTAEVFSATFTVAVEFSIKDDGSIDGGTFVISLKDSDDATNSETNPYIIDTATKLLALPAFLNDKTTAYYFEQTADIDLESVGWMPIGSSSTYAFKGVYDGGEYTVKGLYINAAPTGTAYYGMFGYVNGGTVKNLTVSGEVTITTSYGYIGGIVGYAAAGSTIDNCETEDMTINGGLYTGGIVGYAVKDKSSAATQITNCTNGADVSNSAGSTGYAGGVLGYSCITSYGTISDLTNNGSVTASGTAGGVIGFQNTGGTAAIENVVNTGTIISEGNRAGGLIGYYYGSGSITNGINTGTIYSENNAGGIAGAVVGTSTIQNSANTGAVSGGSYVGGLAGSVTKAVKVWNSSNTGEITGGKYVGGLAGNVSAAAYFRNSYNTGTVTGEFVSNEDGTFSVATYVGGLIGYMSGYTYNCYNSAAVTGESDAQVGTLLGYLAASRTISSSYYLAQDDMNPVAEAEDGSTVEFLGSFDTNGTLTAVDEESGLAYTGDLLNHLNAWVVENINTYADALAWVAHDDGYPVLDSSATTALKDAVPASVTVEMSSENLSKVAYQGTAVLSAAVTLGDDGLIGSVTYQWLLDGEEIADATGTLNASDEAKTFTLTISVDTSASGEHVYTLQAANTNTAYNVAQIDSADAEITVAKDTNLVDWGGTWDIADGFASGDGTAENPYIISNANELAYLAQAINDGTISSAYYYKLSADLNLNGYDWTPIGNSTSTAFQGNFDGNGYTISGLYATGSSYVGLFGITSNANIDNLTLSGDVTGTGAYAVGMLIGCAYGDTAVSNVMVSGTVTSTFSSTATISTTYAGVGGLIGAANSTLTLTSCGNEASVTSGKIYSGGLAGLLSSSYAVSISGCYNAGDVTNSYIATTADAGGLIGYVYQAPNLKVENCYNSGAIKAIRAAGLVGDRYTTEANVGGATFENCYNAGTISSPSSAYTTVYSLLGYYYDGTYETISNCYYLNATATGKDQSRELTGMTGVDVLTSGNLGDAYSEAGSVGTVTFVTEHTSVTANGGTETTTTASASPYPYLNWQGGPLDSSGYVSFRVAIDEGYTLADVSAATGEIVPYNAETYAYVAVVTGDDTVTITDVVPATLTVTGENATLTFASGYAEETVTENVYTIGQTTTVTFTVEADDNYAVTSVVAKISAADEGTALEADADGIYSLTLGTEDATVVITTAPTYQVTLTFENTTEPVFTSGNTKMDYTREYSSGAWIIVDYCLTVIDGTTVTFTVEPDSGYALALDSVLLGENALLVDENGVYSFAVSSDVSGQTLAITGAATKVSVVADDDELIYTGQAITPNVTVTVGGNTVESSYYSVAYNNNIDVGTASVTATLQNGYIGTATGTFSIGQKKLTKDDFTVSETADYNYGTAVEVEIVSDLEPDVDYTVRYANNIDAGTGATLIIYGQGNYTGTLTYEYAIVAAELSSDAVTIEVTGELSYTGEDVKPAVAVSLNGVSMTEGTDYELDYASATEEGNLIDAGNTGIVTVTFQGNYSGTATATYTIAKADQALTVNHDTQELPVSANKNLAMLNLVSGNQTELVYGLTEGDGFTLDGSVLTTPETVGATATITIYAAEGDNYNASEPVAVTVTTVNKAEVSVAFADGTATYTGEALTYEAASVEVEETDGTWTYVYYDADGTKLDSAPTDAGTYTVTATYTSGDSTGTASTHFTIEPQPVEATVALTDSSTVYTYTGNAIEPDVEITVDGAALTEDTVYTYEISYAGNVNASTEESTATVTVTFTGNYSGEASTTFTIEARTLTAEDFALESDSVVYDGTEQKPAVILADGLNLLEGTDYSVVYANNTDVGTATVTITGLKPNCTGSVELTFEITGSDVSESVTVTVADGSYVYTGEAIEPEVTVTMGDKNLTVDAYTVEYANNVNAGTATVTVTLTGNYSATVLTESFTIEKAEQTLVMNNGTIINSIGQKLDLTTLVDESSVYGGTLLFEVQTIGATVTNEKLLGISGTLEAGTEIEVTVYALSTSNYYQSEKVTFCVTAGDSAFISVESKHAEVLLYERTVELDEDDVEQNVDTELTADDDGIYSSGIGATIGFTVTPEDGYGEVTVNVNGETVEADEDGFYLVELTEELLTSSGELTIAISAKRTSWDGDDADVDADIESILASVAAGTESEGEDESTYEDSLDYNDDGMNDLLDILDILYRTEDTDSTDETVEEATSEETTEDATETSGVTSEDASDEDSDESSEDATAESDADSADDSGADSETASEDAAE